MNESYRLIALDLDGTLLTSAKGITQRSIRALSELAATGRRVVIVTGRNLPMARTIALQLPLSVTIIAHNGAVVADAQTGRVWRADLLAPTTARRLCVAYRERACAPFLYTVEDGVFRLRYDDAPGNPARDRYLRANAPVCAPVEDVLDAVGERGGERVIHIVAIETRERVLGALRTMGKTHGAQLMTSGGLFGNEYWFLEAIHARASKVHALESLCGAWGIGLDQVVAIGDNLNDRELLRATGFGVAMGNAPEEVRAAARHVTATNDDEGVAKALAHVFGR